MPRTDLCWMTWQHCGPLGAERLHTRRDAVQEVGEKRTRTDLKRREQNGRVEAGAVCRERLKPRVLLPAERHYFVSP